MMAMGHDFVYENALAYFKNIDKVIKYVNDQVRFDQALLVSNLKSFLASEWQ
jgi:hypothetical protein